MSKRPITFTYLLFYVLFSPDTWQVLMGLLAAYFLTPVVTSPQDGIAKVVILYIMIVTIGYAATRVPAKGVTRMLKKWVLGDKMP